MAEIPPNKPIEEEMKTEKADHAGEEEVGTEETVEHLLDFDPAASTLNIDDKEISEEGDENPQEQSNNKEPIDEDESMKKCQEHLLVDAEYIQMHREMAKREDQEIMCQIRGLDRNHAHNQMFIPGAGTVIDHNFGAPYWRGPQQHPPMANQIMSMPMPMPPNRMNIPGPYGMHQLYPPLMMMYQQNEIRAPMMRMPNQMMINRDSTSSASSNQSNFNPTAQPWRPQNTDLMANPMIPIPRPPNQNPQEDPNTIRRSGQTMINRGSTSSARSNQGNLNPNAQPWRPHNIDPMIVQPWPGLVDPMMMYHQHHPFMRPLYTYPQLHPTPNSMMPIPRPPIVLPMMHYYPPHQQHFMGRWTIQQQHQFTRPENYQQNQMMYNQQQRFWTMTPNGRPGLHQNYFNQQQQHFGLPIDMMHHASPNVAPRTERNQNHQRQQPTQSQRRNSGRYSQRGPNPQQRPRERYHSPTLPNQQHNIFL